MYKYIDHLPQYLNKKNINFSVISFSSNGTVIWCYITARDVEN